MAGTRLIFRRVQRLAHNRQYQAVYAGRVQRSRGPLGVHGAPNGLDFCRLGLAVGRRVGNAVARNRMKRMVREAFRLSQRELPRGEGLGLDLVVTVRPHAGLALDEYRTLLVDLTASIAREWARRGTPRPGDER